MTKKIVVGLIGMLLMGLGAKAEAASCGAAPPTAIVFEAVPSPLAQDTSASAKDLAIKLGADSDRRAPGYYDAGVAISARRDTGIAKLPDGTVCAALVKLTVKLSLERKLWLASELTDNTCVLQAFATQYGARGKADDDAIAQFGQTTVPTYQKQLAAIGWQTAKSQEEAIKEITDKTAPVMTEIQAKFAEQRTAAQSKINLSQLPGEACDGATAKLGHKVGSGNG
ncbi:MAG TPA: hypothetical protein VGV37_08170 [Aliidongia sp.]|uniref:hypothetical protein n=1 Tax=Aliidongia sp. TaxID=1914230 RepID=UPI002DDD99D6|nr:hypothetical protein [Aliidongia sp.]HEV2674502.1 hypothetical protein [Aliidongia sp.]